MKITDNDRHGFSTGYDPMVNADIAWIVGLVLFAAIIFSADKIAALIQGVL